jgi:hypothetical protein
MTSRYMQFGIALAVCSCLFLPACNREKGGGGISQTGTLYISLSIAAAPDNTCQQNGSTGNVQVASGQNVTYQGGAAALSQFDVVFPATSTPFASAVISSPNGAATSAGAFSGTANTPYAYSSLTINNRQCSNPGSLGLIMR